MRGSDSAKGSVKGSQLITDAPFSIYPQAPEPPVCHSKNKDE